MMMINTMVRRLTYVYIREELWDSMSRLLGSIWQIIRIINHHDAIIDNGDDDINDKNH